MPPTMSVTVGRLPAAALVAVPVPGLEVAEEPHAARTATADRAARMARGLVGMGFFLLQAAWASVGDGGRQDSRRRSSRPIRPSAVRARTAMMNMAANTPSGLKLFCALAMTRPRPR